MFATQHVRLINWVLNIKWLKKSKKEEDCANYIKVEEEGEREKEGCK